MRFGGTRKLAEEGAYCAKPGGCKCQTHTNLQLPEVGTTDLRRLRRPVKARTVTFQGRKLKDYCKHPTPGPARPGRWRRLLPDDARRRARGTARAARRPSPGIMIYDERETSPGGQLHDRRLHRRAPGGFTAIASDGAWRLEVGISNFSGFGDYEIPYGGPDPVVVIEGPPGTFSNATWQPGGLPFAGAIAFGRRPHHMGARVDRVPHRRRVGGDQGRRRDDLRLPRRRVARGSS